MKLVKIADTSNKLASFVSSAILYRAELEEGEYDKALYEMHSSYPSYLKSISRFVECKDCVFDDHPVCDGVLYGYSAVTRVIAMTTQTGTLQMFPPSEDSPLADELKWFKEAVGLSGVETEERGDYTLIRYSGKGRPLSAVQSDKFLVIGTRLSEIEHAELLRLSSKLLKNASEMYTELLPLVLNSKLSRIAYPRPSPAGWVSKHPNIDTEDWYVQYHKKVGEILASFARKDPKELVRELLGPLTRLDLEFMDLISDPAEVEARLVALWAVAGQFRTLVIHRQIDPNSGEVVGVRGFLAVNTNPSRASIGLIRWYESYMDADWLKAVLDKRVGPGVFSKSCVEEFISGSGDCLMRESTCALLQKLYPFTVAENEAWAQHCLSANPVEVILRNPPYFSLQEGLPKPDSVDTLAGVMEMFIPIVTEGKRLIVELTEGFTPRLHDAVIPMNAGLSTPWHVLLGHVLPLYFEFQS